MGDDSTRGSRTWRRPCSLIAEQRWREVLALGKAALGAPSIAVDDEDPVIRREATGPSGV